MNENIVERKFKTRNLVRRAITLLNQCIKRFGSDSGVSRVVLINNKKYIDALRLERDLQEKKVKK